MSSHYAQLKCNWSSANRRTPTVVHKYCDHSENPLVVKSKDTGETAQRGAARQFPTKLYDMLIKASCSGDESTSTGFDEIVSWQPHGRCFIVRDPKAFVAEVMPNFFAQSKLTSFQRQLSLYGFARLTKGKDQGAYYHELFLRGRPDLIHDIARTRVKGTGCKASSSPETEPDFYAMKHCCLNPSIPAAVSTPLPSPSSPARGVSPSDATIISDTHSTTTECEQESNKDDESNAMSDDDEAYPTEVDANAIQGIYTHGVPFNARMEFFLPRGFKTQPQLMNNAPVGPLARPGRLCNTVTHQRVGAAKVVKFLPTPLMNKSGSSLQQMDRWAAPLKSGICNVLISDEKESPPHGWNNSTTPATTSTTASITSSTAEEYLEEPTPMAGLLAQEEAGMAAPTLEDIIYMI